MSIPRTDTTGRISTTLAPRVALPLAFALSIAWPAPARAGRTDRPRRAGSRARQGPPPAPGAADANPFGRKYPPRVYQTRRLEGKAPEIDGRLDDEAWKQGEWAGDYTQQIPTEGAPPSQTTELKILYDDKNLYFAIRAYDDPAKVHRYPGRRDDFSRRHRRHLLRQLQRQAHRLRVRPHGRRQQDRPHPRQRRDRVGHHLGRRLGRQGGPRRARLDGRVPRAPEPAPLRPPGGAGVGPARLALDRPQPGRGPVAAHPAPEHGAHVPARRAARHPRAAALPPRRAAAPRARHGRARGRPIREGGTDGSAPSASTPSWASTSNFTLDATVNPDFGQVEADPSVMNLTAYETFYEEKRPFFLEGRSILALRPRGRGPLFYSRRIGAAALRVPVLGPDERVAGLPESTTILSALKITGKTPGGLSVGVVQSLTQKETASIRRRAGSGTGRRALRQLHGGRAPQGLGQGQHQPRRDVHLHPSLRSTTPPSPSCPPPSPAASTSPATSPTAPG